MSAASAAFCEMVLGHDTSGSCNADVICTAAEVGTLLIDNYRDQIRSAASYSIGGVDKSILNSWEEDQVVVLPEFVCARR